MGLVGDRGPLADESKVHGEELTISQPLLLADEPRSTEAHARVPEQNDRKRSGTGLPEQFRPDEPGVKDQRGKISKPFGIGQSSKKNPRSPSLQPIAE